jgi:hypothetical protein
MFLTIHNSIPESEQPLFWSYPEAYIVELMVSNHDNISNDLETNTLRFNYNGNDVTVNFPNCFIYNLNDFIQLINDYCGQYFTVTTEKTYTNKLIYKTTNDTDTIIFYNDNFTRMLGMSNIQFTSAYANINNITLFPYRYYLISSDFFESNYRINNHPCNMAVPIQDYLNTFKWTYNKQMFIKPSVRITGSYNNNIELLVAMFDNTYTINCDFYITFYLTNS